MVWRLPIRLIEGEKGNERSEPTTKRQRENRRTRFTRSFRCARRHDNWMALQLFHLGCIRYVVANRLLGDRSNLRFASVTMLDLFPRYRHFQRAMERSTPFPSKFLFIASNGLTMVAETRPNRRKIVVSRGNSFSLSRERITGDFTITQSSRLARGRKTAES